MNDINIKLAYFSNYDILGTKKFNNWLSILKLILAFSIIRTHNFNYKSTNNKILLYILRDRRIHAPSFFIMPFYFMHKDLVFFHLMEFEIY